MRLARGLREESVEGGLAAIEALSVMAFLDGFSRHAGMIIGPLGNAWAAAISRRVGFWRIVQ